MDCDLEKFFDRVNHDILMFRLARRIEDKRLLRIVRRFLEAGIMDNGVCVSRHEGTPQGGPLSPLLANLLLDDLDKELERRGHFFCRYADDCNIYVHSLEAGERVMRSITRFLETKLRLRVNHSKSAVAHVSKRKFLGYRLLAEGKFGIAPQSLSRVKVRIRRITKRNLPVSFDGRIESLNAYLTGWLTSFQLAERATALDTLDQWIRRKLRCVRLKQCKRAKTVAEFLKGLGGKEFSAWMLALSGKGWWRKAKTWQAHRAMDMEWWFAGQGLVCLSERYKVLKGKRNRRGTEQVCPVV